MDIGKLPYAQWREDTLRALAEEDVESMGIVGILSNGEVYTAYFNSGPQDKLIMAGNIHMDAIYNMIKANAADIVAAADEEGEDDE